jgi:hypothetical protein
MRADGTIIEKPGYDPRQAFCSRPRQPGLLFRSSRHRKMPSQHWTFSLIQSAAFPTFRMPIDPPQWL